MPQPVHCKIDRFQRRKTKIQKCSFDESARKPTTDTTEKRKTNHE
ncbi:hypothetical protein [Azospirillum argentinense]